MEAKKDDLVDRARRRAAWLGKRYDSVTTTTPKLLNELADRVEELDNLYLSALLEIGRLQEHLKRGL